MALIKVTASQYREFEFDYTTKPDQTEEEILEAVSKMAKDIPITEWQNVDGMDFESTCDDSEELDGLCWSYE